MRRFRLSKKNIIWIAACLVCYLAALSLFCVRSSVEKKQISQQMAERWSDLGDVAQISCFFSEKLQMSKFQILSLEHSLDDALQEASITSDENNPDARLWSDAYSAMGNLSVSTDRATLNLKAMGVGGDFFQFHPQELRYGNYFSSRDVNTDYVVIDEETAWQLFGGINVAGMNVNVNGIPHVIAGVIKRPQGKTEKAAGLNETIIYVSMETLEQCMGNVTIFHYEIVMPNPIKDFAMNMLKEKFAVDENGAEFVENTGRFSILASLKLLKQFGTRSMILKGVVYPYWENLARGCEDLLALITTFMVIFFAVPTLLIIFWLIYRWKHKKWTIKSVLKKLLSLLESFKDWIFRKIKANKKSKERKPINITFDEEEEDEKV